MMVEADVLSPFVELEEEGSTALIGEEYELAMWAVRASLPDQPLPNPNLAFLRIKCELSILEEIDLDSRFFVIATYE